MRRSVRHFALLLLIGQMLASAAARADDLAAQFDAASQHYARQEWPAACEAFARLLASDPNQPRVAELHFFYGEALAQLGRYYEARQQLLASLSRDPNHRYARKAQFRAGETAHLAGDAVGARRDLEAFLARYPDDELNGFALSYLGSLDLQSGAAERARQMFAEVLRRFPTSTMSDASRWGLAEACEQLGKLDDARDSYRALAAGDGAWAERALLHLAALQNSGADHNAALQTLLELQSRFDRGETRAQGQLALGFTLFKLGRYEEATRPLSALVKDADVRVEAGYWLGLSYIGRQQWQQAAQTLQDAAQFDETHRLNPAIAYWAAAALAEIKQYPAARDALTRALRRWPKSEWADDCLLALVELANQQSEPQECLALVEQLFRDYPQSPLATQAMSAQGRAFFVLERYDDAARVFKARLQRDDVEATGDRAAALAGLAMCHVKLQRTAEAVTTARQLAVAVSEPSTRETIYQVAEHALAADEFAAARELFTMALAAESGTPLAERCLAGLGWCDFKTSDWRQAAASFGRILNEFPDSTGAAEAALLRGRALEHLEQYDPALGMYHLVFERYAQSPRAAEAMWHAARLHDELHQAAAAKELYARLTKQFPQFDELDAVLYRQACQLEQAGDLTAADAVLERLRREAPESRHAADATLRLAEHAADRGDDDRAAQLLAALAATHKSSDAVRQRAWYLEARIAIGRRQWNDAEQPLIKLLDTYPDGFAAPSAGYLLAEVDYRRGNYRAAAERIARLAADPRAAREPWLAAAELREAQALAQLREWPEAMQLAASIPRRHPQFAETYECDYLIGRALAAQAEFDQARAAYAKVIASPAGHASETAALAQWMIGESYFHQDNYQAALAEYAAVDAYPFPRWRAAALLQAGKCHELLGQWKQAAEKYELLARNFSTSEYAAEAASRSHEIRARLTRSATTMK